MQKAVVLTLGLISLLCAISVPALAAAPDQKIIKAIEARYVAMQSMRGAFTQVLTHKESGIKETRQGELIFQKPMLARWETRAPYAELLVIGKEAIWDYFPEDKEAFKYPTDMADAPGNFIRVLTGQAKLEENFTLADEGLEENLRKIRLYPHEPTQALVEAIIWVEEKTGLIKRVRIQDFYANENEISITEQHINVVVPAGAFTFTPPPGTVFEDRTKPDK